MKKVLLFILINILSSATLLFAQPTDGLAGYFKFNNNALNSGSANITATMVNTPFTTSNNGTPNSAIQFTGATTSYVEITDNGNLDFAGDFSFSFGAMLTSTAGLQAFIDNNVNYGGYGFFFFSNTLTVLLKNGSVQTPAGLFTANIWKAVCITRTGSTVRIYIDGSLVATGSAGGATTTYLYAPVFGQLYSTAVGGNYASLNGKMNEVRIYDRALSASEVLSLVSFTLPLNLLEFNGHYFNNNGLLNWKTTDEQNTASFSIERSADGRNYTAIGNVAAFNTSGYHQYSYADNNIAALGVPVVYYRLKQIDIDSRFTYSRIVALSVDNDKTIVMLYPNPVTNEASLTITTRHRGNIQGRIIDNAGRIIKQQLWTVAGGSTSFTIDVSALAKGIYYLELKGETINERKQFVKQ